MICPYCQTELDAHDLTCSRCGAALPANTLALGFRLRTLVVVGFLTMMVALMLVTCVVPHLSGSGTLTGSYRPAEAMRALQAIQRHQQPSQNPAPPPPLH
jgi:hypothetical protein